MPLPIASPGLVRAESGLEKLQKRLQKRPMRIREGKVFKKLDPNLSRHLANP